jgi:hypothetical protein
VVRGAKYKKVKLGKPRTRDAKIENNGMLQEGKGNQGRSKEVKARGYSIAFADNISAAN